MKEMGGCGRERDSLTPARLRELVRMGEKENDGRLLLTYMPLLICLSSVWEEGWLVMGSMEYQFGSFTVLCAYRVTGGS